MKIKVWTEDEKEKVLRFKLVQGAETENAVAIIAVDKNGCEHSNGLICYIGEDGCLHLVSSINPGLGLELDAEGKIVVKSNRYFIRTHERDTIR